MDENETNEEEFTLLDLWEESENRGEPCFKILEMYTHVWTEKTRVRPTDKGFALLWDNVDGLTVIGEGNDDWVLDLWRIGFYPVLEERTK